jgi:hypothetical protein
MSNAVINQGACPPEKVADEGILAKKYRLHHDVDELSRHRRL